MEKWKLVKKLEEAEPCKKHGREFLVVCTECEETVTCSACDIPCQCWNDE